jgi:branched-chain amino acid transport system ATP-binding protein
MMPLSVRLSVRGLGKSFGGVRAVDGLDFDVGVGEVLAMIGPNGAGKSTTFDMLGGQLAPDRGEVLLEGRSLAGLAPRAVARLGVGRTFQIAQTFSSATVLENVQLALLAHKRQVFSFWRAAATAHRDEAMALLARVGMAAAAARPCHELAYGDVKRVELALALAGSPKLLLMDEPTAGMPPAERLALMALVRELVSERALSVLFTEHSMDVVFGYADRILVLARGRLIAEGDAAAIRADVRVRDVYFGSGKTFEAAAPEAPSAPVSKPPPAGPRPPLLQVQGLNAWYGGAHILYDVALEVGPGEVVALMGRNGAGKSTTLAAIMAMLERRSGTVRLNGQEVAGARPHHIARAGMGFVPEDRRIFTDLSVRENLEAGRQPPRFWPDGRPAPEWSPERLYQLFPNLRAAQSRSAAHLSGGEQQMLSVARTLMGNPLMVLLDEPSEGVAPVIVEQLGHAILALKAAGVGILLSEQNMHFASWVADRAYVLEKGTIRLAASMADLMADEKARSQYLGL